MKDVFLKNGEKASLVKKVDNQYLVKLYYQYYSFEEEEYEDLSDKIIVVDEIFTEAPTTIKSKDYQSLLKKIEKKTSDLSSLETEIYQAKSELSTINNNYDDLKKWRLDLNKYKEAKNIVFYNPSSTELRFTKSKIKRDGGYIFRLSVDCFNNEVTQHGIELDYEGRSGWSNEGIDVDFGILIDPTDEEIKAFVLKRLNQLKAEGSKLRASYIEKTPEIYQPTELKEYMKLKIKEKKKREIENMENTIIDYKKKLKDLYLKQ